MKRITVYTCDDFITQIEYELEELPQNQFVKIVAIVEKEEALNLVFTSATYFKEGFESLWRWVQKKTEEYSPETRVHWDIYCVDKKTPWK